MPASISTSSALSRYLAPALAVLLPLVLFCLGAWFLLADPDEGAELSRPARVMERALAEAQPALLVVGNSLAGRDVDPDVLGGLVAESPVAAATAWEAGTWPANWYLFLKNRVYAQGLRPHVVVICTEPRTLLQAGVKPERALQSLHDHAGEYEPLVYRKAFGRDTPNPWIMRLREGRGRFQDRWSGWLRAGSVGLLNGGPGTDLLERGEARAAPALERVFEVDGAVDITLHQRVIPVVEHADRVEVAADDQVVAASFVADLLALAAEHGTRLVFVRMPMLPHKEQAMAVDPMVQADLVRTLNDGGAAWVDMSGLAYPASMFMDPAHLNSVGRERFTRELAQALRSLDVMGVGPFAPSRVPLALAPQVRLEGELPDLGDLALRADPQGEPCRYQARAGAWVALSDAGLGAAGLGEVSPLVVLEDGEPLAREAWPGALAGDCQGAYVPQAGQLWISPRRAGEPEDRSFSLGVTDALPVRAGADEGWFVYPGTRLVLSFEGWPADPGVLELSLGLEALLGEPDGVRVELMGRPLSLASAGPRWLEASLLAPTPEGPWSISITSPDQGPWLALRWVGLQAGEQQVDLVGSAKRMARPAAQLLGVAGGDVELVASVPLHLPLALEPFGKGAGVRTALPGLDELASTHISTRVPCRRCSPLRLLEDGVEREVPQLSCTPVRIGRSARSCHEDGFFLFTAGDGSDPRSNGRRYALAPREERSAGSLLWVYPGDRMRLHFARRERRLLRDGASALRLEGAAFAGENPDGLVHLALRVGDEVVLEDALPVRSFDGGAVEISLGRTWDVSGKPVALELSCAPDAPFLLLQSGQLLQ